MIVHPLTEIPSGLNSGLPRGVGGGSCPKMGSCFESFMVQILSCGAGITLAPALVGAQVFEHAISAAKLAAFLDRFAADGATARALGRLKRRLIFGRRFFGKFP